MMFEKSGAIRFKSYENNEITELEKQKQYLENLKQKEKNQGTP